MSPMAISDTRPGPRRQYRVDIAMNQRARES